MSSTNTTTFIGTHRVEGVFPHKGQICYRVRNYHDNSLSWLPVSSATLATPYLADVRWLPANLFDGLPQGVAWEGFTGRRIVWVQDAVKYGLVTNADYRYSYRTSGGDLVHKTLPKGSKILGF